MKEGDIKCGNCGKGYNIYEVEIVTEEIPWLGPHGSIRKGAVCPNCGMARVVPGGFGYFKKE